MAQLKFKQTRLLARKQRVKIPALLASVALGFLLLGFNLFTLSTTAQAHAGYERSNPASNASLPSGQPPQQVQVWFVENIEPQFSELTVVNSTDGQVDVGDSYVPLPETNSLVVTLKPGLPDGLYTVNFRNTSADDGHISKGGFSFTVGAAPEAALPQPVNPAPPDTGSAENLNFWTVSLRWLNYLAAAVLLGSLGFEVLVWRRSVRRLVEPGSAAPGKLALSEAVYRLGLAQIRKLAWFGLAGLLVGWAGWVLHQAGSISNQSLGQLIGLSPAGQASGPRALVEFLVGTRYGNVWLARLGIIFFLADVLVLIQPEKVGAARKTTLSPQAGSQKAPESLEAGLDPQEKPASPVDPALETAPGHAPAPVVARQLKSDPPAEAAEQTRSFDENYKWWWVALILSTGIMLTTSLTSHAASKEFITVFTVSFDWLHLLSTAVWLGGLIGLAFSLKAVIPSLEAGSGNRTHLLASLIPAFSQVALIAVTTLILTGVLSASLQLTDIGQLFSTGYGLSLSVKVLLLLILLGLGAYNLLAIGKRMDKLASSKPTNGKRAGSKAAGSLGLKFRRLVLLEIGLAALAFLAAAFLTSNPPPRSLTPPDLSGVPQTVEQSVKLAGDPVPVVVSFGQLPGVDAQAGRQVRVGQ